MTIQEVINQVDERLPNTISNEEKRWWLKSFEASFRGTYLAGYGLGVSGEELCASGPWEELYLHALEGKIYYTQGETARYNQAVQMLGALRESWVNHLHRTRLPQKVTIQYS